MIRLELTRLALERHREEGTFVGDPCPVCKAKGQVATIGVYSIKHKSGRLIRYLSCNDCGWKPDDNKIVSKDPLFVADCPGQLLLFPEDPATGPAAEDSSLGGA